MRIEIQYQGDDGDWVNLDQDKPILTLAHAQNIIGYEHEVFKNPVIGDRDWRIAIISKIGSRDGLTTHLYKDGTWGEEDHPD